MPFKPLHNCNHQGCHALTKERFCEMDKKRYNKDADQQRGTATERGYDANWQKIRNIKLDKDPLCKRCLFKGRDVAADMVHHKDRNSHNHTWENLESLCDPCHDVEHKDEIFKRRQR